MESESLSVDPVNTQRASEVIFERVKNMIVAGELKPGDHIPSEGELSSMFQRSRPTVREALRMLENAGLIKTVPGNKGSVVLELSVDNAAQPLSTLLNINKISRLDLLEYRELNDIAIMGWAAERRTDEDLAVLTNIISEMQDCIHDLNRFKSYAQEFLNAVALCTHNRIVIIMDQIIKQVVPDFIEKLSQEKKTEEDRIKMLERRYEVYRSIYYAIKQKDAHKAREIERNNLKRIRKIENEMMEKGDKASF